jgi:hypothetical protein
MLWLLEHVDSCDHYISKFHSNIFVVSEESAVCHCFSLLGQLVVTKASPNFASPQRARGTSIAGKVVLKGEPFPR